ncbi:hypothetical protein D3C76_1440260 [compost metagenome]
MSGNLRIVKAPGRYRQHCFSLTFELSRDADRAGSHIRSKPDSAQIRFSEKLQLQPAGDPVPVGLGIRRGHVSSFSRVSGVADTNRNGVTACCQSAQIIHMSGVQAVPAADLLAVNIKRCHPRPLQIQPA